MATEIGEGTVNVAKMVGGGFVVTCCFGSQTQAGTNHPTLVRELVHHLRAPVNANRRT